MKMAILAVALAAAGAAEAAASLDEGFRNPPREAKPHTWYHMMNGNVTKEGVTRDFEELAAAGVGGVQMFDAGCAIPAGPLAFNSPEWFDLLKHAAAEAKRLGLEICLPNCSGWSSSGGPWNPASNAMKKVVFTETRVKGGTAFDGRLPRPEDPCGFYEDIAVLAVPVPPAKAFGYEGQRFTSEGETVCTLSDRAIEASGYSLKIEFKPIWRAYADMDVEITRDGASWEPYAKRRIALSLSGRGSRDYRFFAFPAPMRLKGLRIAMRYSNATGSSRRPVEAKATGLRLERKLEIPSLECKTLVMRGDLEPQTPEGSADQVVAKDAVVSLGDARTADGRLRWTAPATAADWALLRIGYTAQPVCNHPASQFGRGFEVDKLSASAMDFHFEQYVAKLCRTLGPLAGGETGLNNILVDSYEVGSQNWTKGLEDEFRRRCGYDPVRYLPAFAGYIVGNADETERFLWDFRRTVADLFAENYAGALARKCHEYGLKLSLEPYGSGPFDNLQYGRHADIPMGEFWSMSKHAGYCGDAGNAKYAAYVGHVWGRRFIGTESFTANPIDSGAWLTTPELIKPIGDAAFADGVNRIIYHRYVHQPWADDRYVPGLTMGQWGMHFDRKNTWWPYAKEFLRYQARCQFMLQQGAHVADVLFWCGEDAPNQGGNTDGGNVSPYRLPYGYDWDVCETEAFRRLSVEEGCVVAPGGTKYRLLVLPPSRTMSPEVLAKLGELVRAGAKVAGPVRPTAAPGLRGYPSADARVAAEAGKVWAAGVMELEAEAALRALDIEPDVAATAGGVEPRWDHRRTDEADIYFLCRNNDGKESFTCSFRVRGRCPEIWDAEKGVISVPRQWRADGGRTSVTLDFETCGSAFVVFRRTPTQGLKRLEASVPVAERTVDGPWEVSFAAQYEGAPKPRRFDRLVSWTESDDPGLKYLSGSATYEKTVEIEPPKNGERVILDLGMVRNFAEVTVNGHTCLPLWKPPYRLDVTDFLTSKPSRLSVKVTNLWPNRLIGDDALPTDVEWKKPEGAYQPIKEIPQWVKDGKKSPTGRHTFTTWRFWKADDPLLPSGLLGPVRLITEKPAPGVLTFPDAPFPMPPLAEVRFPDCEFRITDYGAKADGTKCTEAFAAAMAACEKAGGGRVVVPAGRWLTGAVRFRNGCELHLDDKAVLEFTDDPADYPAVHTSWEGTECWNHSPLLFAYGVTNVAITGGGLIEPRMNRWSREWAGYDPKQMAATRALYMWGATNAAMAARRLLDLDGAKARPHLIQFNRAKDVLLDGFRINGSPFWLVHLYHSENCIVRNLSTYARGLNSDGLDIEMTRNVLVENCRFDQGDDGIVLKAGRNADAWRLDRPTENVVVRNCDLASSHSLLGIGSELSGGIRNVWVTGCRVESAFNLFNIKTGRRRGGFVRDVWVEDCAADDLGRVFNLTTVYTAQYSKFPDFEIRYTDIGGIHVRNVRCNRARTGISLSGDRHRPPRGIEIRDVRIGEVIEGLSKVTDCEDVRIDGLTLGRPDTSRRRIMEAELDKADVLAAVSPGYARAIEFLRRPDLKDLPPGRHAIDGERVFAEISEVVTAPFSPTEKMAVRDDAHDLVYFIVDGEEEMFEIGESFAFHWVWRPLVLAIPAGTVHSPHHTNKGPKRIRVCVIRIRREK